MFVFANQLSMISTGSFCSSLLWRPPIYADFYVRQLHFAEVCWQLNSHRILSYRRYVVKASEKYSLPPSDRRHGTCWLEVREYFTLLPHREYPDVVREVIDEPHIISTTIECCFAILEKYSSPPSGRRHRTCRSVAFLKSFLIFWKCENTSLFYPIGDI